MSFGRYSQVKEVGLKKQLELLFRLQAIDSNIKRAETLPQQFEEEVANEIWKLAKEVTNHGTRKSIRTPGLFSIRYE